MTHLLEGLWAHIRCEWYLLTSGMWKGECKFCGWSKTDGKICLIATTTGSIQANTIEVTRVFFDSRNHVTTQS